MLMSNDYEKAQAAIQKGQTVFIENRAFIESEINKFFASLANLTPDIQQQINYNPEVSARAVLPVLWADKFDKEVYEQQLKSFMEYFNSVAVVLDKLNQEALLCAHQLEQELANYTRV